MPYKEGDAVLVKDFSPKIRGERKLADKWVGPYFILDTLSDVLFRLIDRPENEPRVLHHDRLKPYHVRADMDVSWVLKRSKTYCAQPQTAVPLLHCPRLQTVVPMIRRRPQPMRATQSPSVLTSWIELLQIG